MRRTRIAVGRWTPGLALVLAGISPAEHGPVECTAVPGRAFLGGTVVEDSTGAPVPGVHLGLDGPGPDTTSTGPNSFIVTPRLFRGVSTDSAGRFCFSNLLPFQYTITLSGILRSRRVPTFTSGPDQMQVAVDLLRSDSSLVIRYDSWGLTLEEQATRAQQLAALAEARARWAAARFQQYSFEISLECFCTARFAHPSSVHVPESANPGSLPEWIPRTIEGVFEILAAELADRHRTVDTVSYDARLGFPVYFRTDTRGGWTDSYREWRLTSFRTSRP